MCMCILWIKGLCPVYKIQIFLCEKINCLAVIAARNFKYV